MGLSTYGRPLMAYLGDARGEAFLFAIYSAKISKFIPSPKYQTFFYFLLLY